jgi:alkyl hydroperoxide reductase subunit AhpC
LNEVLHCFEHTNGCVLGVTTDNSFSKYTMTHVMQTTPEASEIEWPALRNLMQCMAHSIQLALGAFRSSLGVNSNTKSWEAHEGDQKFGEN